jgi:hypothetical protein
MTYTLAKVVPLSFLFLICTPKPFMATAQGAKVPAFPGAEGFGACAVGGRGGKICQVTNLQDSGPGSLREAVETKGPRIIVFRISGNIELKSSIVVRNPYVTVAGQSAPGGGICLKDYPLTIAADHVVVRYLRCRPGDNMGKAVDAISISAGKNIIVDHCSASWPVDETLSASSSGQLGNVTVQWCIINESLNKSAHGKGSHGYGSLIRGSWGNAYSFHHNLYAHHKARLPRPGNYNGRSKDPEGFTLDFRNNVIYNWGGSYAGYNADGSSGTDSITKMNFVGNCYKQGPNSTGSFAFHETTTCGRAYFDGNSMNGSCPDDPWSLVTFTGFSEDQKNTYKQSESISVAPVKTGDALTVYEQVLALAGATLPDRDMVDARIVREVAAGTGRIIDDEDEVGGWPRLKSLPAPSDSDRDGMPDTWEIGHHLRPNNPTDGAVDSDSDGYTNVEEFLNGTNPRQYVDYTRIGG